MGWTEDETFWVRIHTFSPDRDLTLCSKRSFIHTRRHHGPKGSTYVLIYIATNCSSAELELAQNEEFIQCATEAAAQTTEPEWFSFNDPAIDYYSWSSQNCIPQLSNFSSILSYQIQHTMNDIRLFSITRQSCSNIIHTNGQREVEWHCSRETRLLNSIQSWNIEKLYWSSAKSYLILSRNTTLRHPWHWTFTEFIHHPASR